MSAAPAAGGLAAEVVRHHLRLFGLRDGGRDGGPLVLARPGAGEAAAAGAAARAGRPVVALEPDEGFARALGASPVAGAAEGPALHACDLAGALPWGRLRSLHGHRAFAHPAGAPVLRDAAGAASWLWAPSGASGVLLVGTDLPGDLLRYRQGDPARAAARDAAPLWGFAGERPLYLYEAQLAGEAPHERHADWWGTALVAALRAHAGLAPGPVLPGGAPGAVLVTGDDDQALPENYARQLAALGDLPVTYFLHPGCKLDRAAMARLFAGRRVDLGLHPDALEAPERYGALYAEQAAWFRGLVGRPALSVRNHGFLNDGYWGHAPHWIAGGARLSSNLPGLDGRVLNGSLLPARLALSGALTGHWSALTAIGDGAVFALGLGEAEAGRLVTGLADRVRASGVPGVIVLNLHPDNVARTGAMHAAAREVVAGGFVAWTAAQMLAWFERGEAPRPGAAARALARLGRPLARLTSAFRRPAREGAACCEGAAREGAAC